MWKEEQSQGETQGFDLNNPKSRLAIARWGPLQTKQVWSAGMIRSLFLDMSGLRCLLGVPRTLASELRSQVSHFYLCSLPKAFRVLGLKRARDHTAGSDSLTPGLMFPLFFPSWLLQTARCEVGVNGLQCPFLPCSHSLSPSPLPKPALMTNLLEIVLSHNSY